MKTYDAIVIGSGIGGLVSAGMLASRGLKTLMIEKRVTPGGYLSSFKRKGFVFDSAVDCVSGVAPGGLIYRVLKMLRVESEVTFDRVDPIRVSHFPDFDITVDADVNAYRERLSEMFPLESSGIGSFLDRVGRTYSQLNSILQSTLGGRFELNMLTPDLLRLMDRSYGELLDEYFKDCRLKAVLSDRCPFIGLPPAGVSAVAMINLMMSYFDLGAFRPKGGYQRLADIFIEGIRKHDGDAIFGNGVKQILLDEKKCCRGVKCENGEEYLSRYMVSNADFLLTFGTLLGGSYKQIADEMMRKPGVSTSFFILYTGLEGELKTHSSAGYYPSYNISDFFHARMEFREDSTIGVTIASREDRSRAPHGCETVVFHEMIEASDKLLNKADCTDRVLRKAEKIFPRIKDKIIVLEAATPSTLMRYTGNYNGAAFGWKRIPGFRGPKRHGIGNLHIAGHWGDLGGGVLAAAYSGAKAAVDILAREGIKDVI
ncbi:MAG: phytoene desaturase family protein [Dissulfurispiraceae bacterium]